MLLNAHRLPSLEAWNALSNSGLIPRIAQDATSALQGEVKVSQEETLDLQDFALPELTKAGGMTAWSSLVNAALTEYTQDDGDLSHRKLTSLDHPLAIAVSLFRERLVEFHQFGFSSPRAFAHAIAACAELLYCTDRCDEYWLGADGRLTFVSRNIHGDMHVSQAALPNEDAPADPSLPTQLDLFAGDSPSKERSPMVKHGALPVTPIATLNQWQDWSPMLGSLLVFARKAGASDLKEIADYRTVLQELDRSTAATAEAEFGTDMMFLPQFVRESAVLDLASIPVDFPNTFCAGPGENASTYAAVYHANKLWFPSINHLTKRARASATTERPFAECLRQELRIELEGEATSSQVVRFSVEDLPQALRATYRLFCRDPRRVEALLRLFTGSSWNPVGKGT